MVQDGATLYDSLIGDLINKGVILLPSRIIGCKPPLFNKLRDLRSPKPTDLKRYQFAIIVAL